MKLSGLTAKARLFTAIVAGTLILVGAMAFYLALRPASALSDGAIAASELKVRLNTISINLFAYLQDRDPGHIETIHQAGEEAALRARRYEAALPKEVQNKIRTSYDALRDSTLALLQADEEQAEALIRFRKSNAKLGRLLRDVLPQELKPLQLGFTARQRALMDLQNDSTGLAQTLSDNVKGRAMPDPGAFDGIEANFHAALRNWSRGGRNASAAEECGVVFAEAIRQARLVVRDENIRRLVMQQYLDSFKAFEGMMDLYTAPTGSTGRTAGRWMLAVFAALLTISGALLVVVAERFFKKVVATPLRMLLQATDAAAAGDLSGTPDLWSRDEVGQLSQALGRLIAVLARSEKLVYHLASLVELSGDAIISQNMDGTILSWNKGAQRMYGYSVEEVKGQPISLLTPEDGGAALFQILERLKQGEKIQPFEMIQIAKNGRTVRAFVRVAAIFDSTRRIIGASFCAQDLSDAFPALPSHQTETLLPDPRVS